MAGGGTTIAAGVSALPEAELFAFAEDVLIDVLGRIRETDRDVLLPPLTDLPGPSRETPLWSVVEQYAVDDASVPHVLAGTEAAAAGVFAAGPVAPVPGRRWLGRDVDGGDVQAVVVCIARAATAAARAANDGDAPVHARYGDVSTRQYLLRLTVNRSLLAHYVAAYLGSTACPLPEELARPLWQATQPHADRWRARGIFGEPMPVPHLASWRDTFLLTAGHLPHPLGH